MKIQVIGARGMLGQAVVRAAQRFGYAVHASAADITSCAVIGSVVINCAGLVKQRQALDSEFVRVNGFGPQRLAEACEQFGARLIQVSTDCVFAGPGPHPESDLPDGRGIYALSKRIGEVTRAPHLTIRTSFVGFGCRGLLVDLQARRGQTVQASFNALWTGHTVPAVAALLVELVSRPDVTGLLHVPAETLTRPHLIELLSRRFDLGITVVGTDEPAEDRRLASERWPALDLWNIPEFAYQLEHLKP